MYLINIYIDWPCVSVNDLDLHKIYNAMYTTIDTYTHNTTLDFRPCNFQ